MNRFNNDALENAYDHFLFCKEKDYSEEIEDVIQFEKLLTEYKVRDFQKEFDVGFILSWNETLGLVLCKSEGLEAPLKEHTPHVFKKGYQLLPDFLHCIAVES